MKKLFLFLCILIPDLASAQNWQNVCSPGITFFKDTTHMMSAFRLDSLTFSAGGDTTYFSYRTIRDTTEMMTCLDTTGGSVLGNRVVLTHDGWYLFFNSFGDTIRLNSLAGLNQNWKFCDLEGGSYVQATVSQTGTGLVLGQPDEIRTITLQAKTSAGNNFNHPVNSVPFKLSQTYGLLTFYDVYHLPLTVIPVELAGKSTPSLGMQEFGYREVYDFAIGDIFHYQGWGQDMGGSATWKKIETILNKTVYGNSDSVDYLIERCMRTEGGPPPTVITSHDTITHRYYLIYMDTTAFLSLPWELTENNQLADKYQRRAGDFNDRQIKTIEDSYYAFNIFVPGCWALGLWEFYMITEYAPGLGNTFYRHLEMYWENGSELVYFQKGGETWGNPVAANCEALVGIVETQGRLLSTVTISPNPVRKGEPIRISVNPLAQNLRFTLYNLNGMPVYCIPMENSLITINSGILSSGLYIWHLSDGNEYQTGKMMVE